MITLLAPLGATHSITLALVYDGVKLDTSPPPEGEARYGAALTGNVTVTAFLKPLDGKKGENPRTLQFKGPIAEVEAELVAKLPQVTKVLLAHTGTLEQLEADLKAEQAKAQKDHEAKKTAAANTTRTGVKSTTHYPAKKAEAKKPAAARSAAKASGAKKIVKRTAAKKPVAKPTAAAATGTAQAALEKLRKTAAAEKKPKVEPAAPSETPELALGALAAGFEAKDESQALEIEEAQL